VESREQELIEAVRLSFGPSATHPVARDLSFRLIPGQILWVGGANGAGKTTLLRAILGQAHILSGSLNVRLSPDRIGYLPQLSNRFFHLPATLGDIVALSRPTSHPGEGIPFDLLSPHHLPLAWNTASGGERKRALLARVLLARPDLLLLDEPLSHLDEESYAVVLHAIRTFVQSGERKGALIVEHEPPPEGIESLSVVKISIGQGDHR
jgi:ABC-type Mn2+/Zn2+ transport system ATPase subunit